MKKQFAPILFCICMAMLTLACGQITAEQSQQARDAAATARALAPTLQAGAEQAADIAGTAAAQLATAAPTLQAQAESAVTAAAQAAEQGGELIATVQAGDINLSNLESIFEMVSIDESGQFSVMITPEQLNTAVRLQPTEASETGEVPTVSNMHFTFGDGAIVLNGNINEPVETTLIVVILPYVDGGLKFEVTQAMIGSINIPSSLVDGVESVLNDTIGSASNKLPAGFYITNVMVNSEAMTIIGQRE